MFDDYKTDVDHRNTETAQKNDLWADLSRELFSSKPPKLSEGLKENSKQAEKPVEPLKGDLDFKYVEDAYKTYNKNVEAWKPENYAKQILDKLKQGGLDEKTMDMLRAREYCKDVDKVLEHLNKDPEAKKLGISLKKSEDGQAVILEKDGQEKQRDFLQGKDCHAGWSRQSTPEKEAEIDKVAKNLADEIKRSGTLSEASKAELRKHDINNGFFNDNKHTPSLLERINKELQPSGLKINERHSGLEQPPSEPTFPWTVKVGGGDRSSLVHLDLVGKDGKAIATTYWGKEHIHLPD